MLGSWPGPPENPAWWDHPEADPLADLIEFAERVRREPVVYQPPVYPDWLIRRIEEDPVTHPHPLRPPQPGDLEKLRTSRLVQATRYLEQHPGLSEQMRGAIAAWIRTGGRAPWEEPLNTGGRSYPPVEPEGRSV